MRQLKGLSHRLQEEEEEEGSLLPEAEGEDVRGIALFHLRPWMEGPEI